ncbi:YceI family protein [Sulfurirhabdus autotrophica]|uniref:Polyisoprenoid-binding protein YceI n=1 Tax=Sulfurirhabdus autotrophica TaxID=1706046 RepID=A0A4R3YDU9_9PROT|nr:YceI family protein [Sulfurirhabdus autotrophica]TCV89014.1 polyisoprenoid-binding protein YceI [Sulfurirhabdus autotrophica]
MNKSLIALALTSMISVSAFAGDNYKIDPRHTFPSFEINHLGYSIQRGRFNHTSGNVELDTAAKQGKIDITIDATSISTGLPDLEKHLQGEDFFDTEKYPTITFTSTKLKFDGDKLVGAEGNFTMHGVTKPVSLQIDHFKCAPNPMTKVPTCGANATTTIKRTDFGISKYAPALGDEVKIAIQVEANKT